MSTTLPPLPGADVPGGVLPNTTQVGPPPAVPAFWQDPVRIVRVVLDIWEINPAEAAKVHQFAQDTLARIRAGK